MTSLFINNYNDNNNWTNSNLTTNTNSTPSLNQGDLFKNFQNKFKYKSDQNYDINGREGFTQRNSSSDNSHSITQNSKNILNQTNMDSEKQTTLHLDKEYKETLIKRKILTQKLEEESKDYFKRINPAVNQYLNKNITIGQHNMYVTNQGVAKWYRGQADQIMGVNGCPAQSNSISLDIPWDEKYKRPGAIIPTTPILITGTPMIVGQMCGNEGSNVYVDEMLPSDVTTSYVGVYGNSRAMRFIGGHPKPKSAIRNGNFDTPIIANNSYETPTVPGWTFNAVLMNNSSAWGYPTYPNGPQAASLQNSNSMSQTLYLQNGTSTLSFMSCGRPGYSGANTINVQLNGTTIYTYTPSTTAWASYSTPLNVTTSGPNVVSFVGTNTTGDMSSAIQNVTLSASSSDSSDSSGNFTYDMCKQAAIMKGFQYFGLQDVNTSTSTGYCAVTNDIVGATRNGQSMKVQSSTILWESNTGDGQGSSASLTSQGILSVYDSTGKVIYSTTNTPNDKSGPNNYIGCYVAPAEYGSGGKRHHHHHHKIHLKKKHKHKKHKKKAKEKTCQEKATDKSHAYYVVGEKSKCFSGNDLNKITKLGAATNCTKGTDNSYIGGGNSMAVYNAADSSSMYWLTVRDDGAMVVIRGQNEGDKQGLIWNSGTEGKSIDANPMYAAKNGKYGVDYMTSGQTLAPGDFIGSTDGKTGLIMETDGNLVLYAWTMVPNSDTMGDGNIGGDSGGTALYELSTNGVIGNMGRLAYIDANSKLHEFPAKNFKYANNYKHFAHVNAIGDDIDGASYTGATAEQCAKTCNSLDNCAGFVLNNNSGECLPKTHGMYPNGDIQIIKGVDTYVRSKTPRRAPLGAATSDIFHTDSVTFQNYTNGGGFAKKYGLAKATSRIQDKIDQTDTKLDGLASQLDTLSSQYISNTDKINSQIHKNTQEYQPYLSELDETNKEIKNMGPGINNILNNSDIAVLQRNYDYLFWSILATGAIIVSMNVVKK
jgi:hypothetical protein